MPCVIGGSATRESQCQDTVCHSTWHGTSHSTVQVLYHHSYSVQYKTQFSLSQQHYTGTGTSSSTVLKSLSTSTISSQLQCTVTVQDTVQSKSTTLCQYCSYVYSLKGCEVPQCPFLVNSHWHSVSWYKTQFSLSHYSLKGCYSYVYSLKGREGAKVERLHLRRIGMLPSYTHRLITSSWEPTKLYFSYSFKSLSLHFFYFILPSKTQRTIRNRGSPCTWCRMAVFH